MGKNFYKDKCDIIYELFNFGALISMTDTTKTNVRIVSNMSDETHFVIPFTKEGENIIVDQLAPKQLIEQLEEENLSFMHEGKMYAFVYYKNKDKESKKIATIAKAVAGLPKAKKDAVKKIAVMMDSLALNMKHLVAKIIIENTPTWNVKSKKEEVGSVEVSIVTPAKNVEGVEQGIALAKAQMLAMRLVEMPSNYLTPKKFYEEAKAVVEEYKKITSKSNVTIDKIVGDNLKIANYGSMYAVSKGSVEEAHLVTLQYNGGKEGDKPLVLVGKGLTFDSGGISIKPSRGMGRMKGDMAGAATVLATFLYAMLTGSKQNIVAILACAENMPDANALKPGDVITANNGKTIEVEDTDAEGRLVLADALCHAQKFNGHTTIDFATLTGACIVALGHVHTGLFTDDDALRAKLVEQGNKSGDTVWALPMGDEYAHFLKSEVADLNNLCIGQGAGATNGAIFLKEFAPKTGWVHMDIAGTSEVKGATGRPVPLMSDFVDTLDE